jgi:glutamate synthase (NADPH/NADH) small chain
MNTGMDFTFLCKEPPPANGRKVAIIGAGPSGLAASGYLACQGYAVDLYDKLPKAGGLMVFGIPGHRIPAGRVEQGVQDMTDRYPVGLHMRTKICGTKPMHEDAGDHFAENIKSLGGRVEDHDAVLICTGTWKSRRLGIPGEDLSGVYSSLQFLFPIRAAQYSVDAVSPIDVKGRKVAVIGAGHSAVDVVHSALAQGASEVYLVYRRTKRDCPCGTFEIDHAVAAGAQFLELCSPVRITGKDKVEGLEFTPCELGEPDASGRCCPVPKEGGNKVLDVDVVVTAIGEIPTAPFAHELGLENVRKGEIHWLQMTAMDGVFVAGDALTGPSKIGKAVYSGLRAARSLHEWLDLRAQNREQEFRGSGLMRREELFSSVHPPAGEGNQ